MFFHILVILSEKILTVLALSNNTVRNALCSFFKSVIVSIIGQVNLIREKTRDSNIFIITRFMDDIDMSKLYRLLVANFRLIISYPLNFSTTDLQRFFVTLFFLSTFFCIRNLCISRCWKNLRKKLYLKRMLFA